MMQRVHSKVTGRHTTSLAEWLIHSKTGISYTPALHRMWPLNSPLQMLLGAVARASGKGALGQIRLAWHFRHRT